MPSTDGESASAPDGERLERAQRILDDLQELAKALEAHGLIRKHRDDDDSPQPTDTPA